MKRTYESYFDLKEPRKQIEYTEPTQLLGDDGTLLVKGGWARHNNFIYDRTKCKPQMRAKEWDFYQVSDGNVMLQMSTANISLGGYCSATMVNLHTGEVTASTSFFVGKKNKVVLPPCGDVPNYFEYKSGKYFCYYDTKDTYRKIYYKGPCKGKMLECEIEMDIMEGLENITTVLPFKDHPTRYFMTTKQNCMPSWGTVKLDGKVIYEYKKENTFTGLDWGRVDTPYKLVWYWGNGSTYVTDKEGKKHLFGFEITWGIGNEDNATETCIFYDGKAHKFGSVDVKTFPKPDKYMEDWEFVSEDGRFNFVMKPFFDNHSDMNALVARMHSHQVHGIWNGTAVLDVGTVVEVKDMYAFCEYVENRW